MLLGTECNINKTITAITTITGKCSQYMVLMTFNIFVLITEVNSKKGINRH